MEGVCRDSHTVNIIKHYIAIYGCMQGLNWTGLDYQTLSIFSTLAIAIAIAINYTCNYIM